MDSYNRGYNRGLIIDENPNEIEKIIGEATITLSKKDEEAVSNSFYGISYKWTHGGNDVHPPLTETIISYRGTDDVVPFGPSDLAGGFLVGGGYGGAAQALLAAQFYHTVSQQIGQSNPYSTGITLTGHSLGGGLSALMASVYGQQAVIFDSMAYELAADYAYHSVDEVLDEFGNPGMRDPAAAAAYYGSHAPQAIDSSGVSGYQVDGQILQWNTPSSAILLGDGLATGGLSSKQLHSMALLVLLLYAHTKATADADWFGAGWEEVSDWLLPSLFDEEVAEAGGFTQAGVGGTSSAAEKLRTMIAYSAIEEGERPFVTGDEDLLDMAGALAAVAPTGRRGERACRC